MGATAIRKLCVLEAQVDIFEKAPSPYLEPVEAREFAVQHGCSWFESDLIDALAELRSGQGPAALHIAGAPILPATTPTLGTPGFPVANPDTNGQYSGEICLLGLAYHLGVPYGYAREHKGAVIQQVVALPGRHGAQSSEGSDAPLRFHTENSFAETRPDFLFLLCRREGPVQVPTLVLDVNEILDRISSSAAEMLGRPIFSVRSPASFGEPPFLSTGTRVLDTAAGKVELRIDLEGLLDSGDRDGKAALTELFASIIAAGTPVRLGESDILIIDNRRAAHARPAFRSIFDGQQRWLQRCLVRSEFWTCRSAMQAEGVQVL
jgi:Taurine catabolism dioxygenase TauD, TfdA family